mmetsp:Transcript_11167/g.30878  ORF Transcript_11167/g.30878 Transcript_11167/m.30878 type:complete len:171 (-) Transcript_11167:289-801(-)
MVRSTAQTSQSDARAKSKLTKKKNVACQANYKRKGWAMRLVFNGTKEKTSGGLKKSDLMKNKAGRVVSKKMHANGKLRYARNGLDAWSRGLVEARRELNLKGFVAVRGKSKDGTSDSQSGTSLYARVAELYAGEISARMNNLLRLVGSQCRVPSLSLEDTDALLCKAEDT